jgi:16S rRNA (cytidine1402-2'-O)-methyltransferase
VTSDSGPEAGEATRSPGGTLYVVATPIGNLRDVTLRALDVLAAVPLIAAEDTRLSRRLLDRYDIKTRTVSYHAKSGPARLESLLDHLRGGADLALVTDAGTPIVSDPGEDIAVAWAGAGGRVEAIPGASAVLAAVVSSAIAGPRWGFEGFLPRSGRERRERLARIAGDDRATVLFEAPTRLRATLGDLAAACGANRPAAVCRELTKLHEEVARGTLQELSVAAANGTIPNRGEIAIVVAGRDAGRDSAGTPFERDEREHPHGADDAVDAAVAEVERLVQRGVPRGEAARQVASARGIPRRRLYRPPAEHAE